MQQFNPNPYAWGTTVTRTQAEVDQGLRAFMLGVYNNMILGLAISGLVAFGTNMLAVTQTAAGRVALTPLSQALYVSPLKWVVMLAPLAFIFFFSFRMDRMSAASARTAFFAFSAGVGLSLASTFLVFTGARRPRPFFLPAAPFRATSLYGSNTKTGLSKFGSFP